ncbi:MAG: AMP-dependent synthetase/ligase, partial [Candidatus Omnitrophota bacterium]
MALQNLREKFEEAASKQPEKIAIKHKKDSEWGSTSYKELCDSVRSVSVFLQEEGVGKDDKIAILLENRPEWPLVFFSTVFIGAISIPINPGAAREEIENILRNSECKYIFTGESSLGLVEEISHACPTVKKVVSVDSDEFKSAAKRTPEELKKTEIGRDDLACILYTSGTTAEPKGVMLSHENLLANCDSQYRVGLITQEDNVISILPLHHIFPLTATMILPLLYGGRIVYPGTMRGEAVLEAVRESGVSVFIAVPQIFYSFHQKILEGIKKVPFPINLLLKLIVRFLNGIRKKTGVNLARYFFRSIHGRFGRSMRIFVSGGAKLDENVGKDLFRLGFTILEGYGLTETSPVLTINPFKKPKIGSVGLPVPDVELKVIEKNKEGIGEVVARGRNIMKGYYKREDLTADVIKDGWFHTGDLGYIDEDGYLFLTGRLKDVIVLSSGVNVYPDEVEEAYIRSAPVKKMCVFEVPVEKGGEEVLALWAIVVPDLEYFRKYGEVNLKAVIKERFDNVSRKLPSHMWLMGFSITLEELPHTLLGKIKRFAVKDIYAPRVAKEGYIPEPEELSEEDSKLIKKDHARKIINYLKKQTGVKKAVYTSSQAAIGVD